MGDAHPTHFLKLAPRLFKSAAPASTVCLICVPRPLDLVQRFLCLVPKNSSTAVPPLPPGAVREIHSLRDLSPQQWKSGIAAWLGWLFDGLDMHLYILVATPFVAELFGVADQKDRPRRLLQLVDSGRVFVRLGTRRRILRPHRRPARAQLHLMATILTYALFTGLSYFAQTWWQLLILRFLAALGIGGEWAVGASLLSETWPRRWRPWMAAVLQTGVNLGVMFAALANFCWPRIRSDRVPGRRAAGAVGAVDSPAVPEPEEWHAGQGERSGLFARVRRFVRARPSPQAVLTLLVCGLIADRPLGVHVLVHATPAELAGASRAGTPPNAATWSARPSGWSCSCRSWVISWPPGWRAGSAIAGRSPYCV